MSWHGGCIPEENVWVKIGGDHGGGSFKFAFCVTSAVDHAGSTSGTRDYTKHAHARHNP